MTLGNAKRAVALSTAAIYFAVNAVGAHAEEKNFWEQRRGAVREFRAGQAGTKGAWLEARDSKLLAHLPAAASLLPPGTLRGAGLPISPIQGGLEGGRALISSTDSASDDLPAWLSRLVLPHGAIREIHLSKNPKSPLILHIQDVHGQPEAQENIARIIQDLAEERGIRLIGVEGAEGPFLLDDYRAYPEKDINRKVAEEFFRRGHITGPEYAGLTAEKPLTLWGVEDASLYGANVRAVKEALKLQAELNVFSEAATRSLSPLKQQIFSPALQEYDRRQDDYRTKKLGLDGYVDYLLTAGAKGEGSGVREDKKFPNLFRLREAFQREKSLNFEAVEGERLALIETLADNLSEKALDDLVQRSLLYRLGRITYGDYYDFLEKLCARNSLPLAHYKGLSVYIAYVRATEKINRDQLFQEMAGLEQKVREALADTAPQRELLSITQDWTLLSKLLRLEMTPNDWRHYETRRPHILDIPQRLQVLAASTKFDAAAFTVPSAETLKAFEEFCRIAVQRNNALADNLLSKMNADRNGSGVLVAGGFHTDGLTRILRARGASYVVITPHIGNVQDGKKYLDVFARDPLPLEKLFSGEPISLNPPLATAVNAPAERKNIQIALDGWPVARTIRRFIQKSRGKRRHEIAKTVEAEAVPVRKAAGRRGWGLKWELGKSPNECTVSLQNPDGKTYNFHADHHDNVTFLEDRSTKLAAILGAVILAAELFTGMKEPFLESYLAFILLPGLAALALKKTIQEGLKKGWPAAKIAGWRGTAEDLGSIGILLSGAAMIFTHAGLNAPSGLVAAAAAGAVLVLFRHIHWRDAVLLLRKKESLQSFIHRIRDQKLLRLPANRSDVRNLAALGLSLGALYYGAMALPFGFVLNAALARPLAGLGHHLYDRLVAPRFGLTLGMVNSPDWRSVLGQARAIASAEYAHDTAALDLARRAAARLERLGASPEPIAAMWLSQIEQAKVKRARSELPNDRIWGWAERIRFVAALPYKPLMAVDPALGAERVENRKAVQYQMGLVVQEAMDPDVLLAVAALKIEKLAEATGQELQDIARELRHVYAPLMERLHREGIAKLIRDEVFKRSDPAAFKAAENAILRQTQMRTRQDAEDYLIGIKRGIEIHLSSNELIAEGGKVHHRVKSAYSYHLKPDDEKETDRKDLLGLLINVGNDNEDDLYKVIMSLMRISKWMPSMHYKSNKRKTRGFYEAMHIYLGDEDGREFSVLVMPKSIYKYYRAEEHWVHALRKEPDIADQDFTDTPLIELTDDYRANFHSLLKAQGLYVYDTAPIEMPSGTFYDPYQLARSDRPNSPADTSIEFRSREQGDEPAAWGLWNLFFSPSEAVSRAARWESPLSLTAFIVASALGAPFVASVLIGQAFFVLPHLSGIYVKGSDGRPELVSVFKKHPRAPPLGKIAFLLGAFLGSGLLLHLPFYVILNALPSISAVLTPFMAMLVLRLSTEPHDRLNMKKFPVLAEPSTKYVTAEAYRKAYWRQVLMGILLGGPARRVRIIPLAELPPVSNHGLKEETTRSVIQSTQQWLGLNRDRHNFDLEEFFEHLKDREMPSNEDYGEFSERFDALIKHQPGHTRGQKVQRLQTNLAYTVLDPQTAPRLREQALALLFAQAGSLVAILGLGQAFNVPKGASIEQWQAADLRLLTLISRERGEEDSSWQGYQQETRRLFRLERASARFSAEPTEFKRGTVKLAELPEEALTGQPLSGQGQTAMELLKAALGKARQPETDSQQSLFVIRSPGRAQDEIQVLQTLARRVEGRPEDMPLLARLVRVADTQSGYLNDKGQIAVSVLVKGIKTINLEIYALSADHWDMSGWKGLVKLLILLAGDIVYDATLKIHDDLKRLTLIGGQA
jgi:hypothetical protein